MEVMTGVDEVFAREYGRLVRSLAVAYDAESASDAVQEAFIEADRRWRRVGKYDDPAGWVRRVALNRLRNGRRNRIRRAEILATIRSVPAEDLTDDLLDLRRSIDELPERLRVPVCLHYLGGFTVDEVAGALNIAPGTVKSHLHDARHRLRAALEDDRHG
jgi:RNA polymerase sigma-70 factor (ECF subfamily)